MLPELEINLLHGERPASPAGSNGMRLRDTAGISAAEFRTFAEPGYAKTVYSLSVRPLEDGNTLLVGLMRGR
ncbi:hypothetical protein [Pseudonocardia asaccharolytica]|uniref:Uncharacterized protein n=1 Tax=Pseudonocardia asaccharolytica DSM 44247 = NBRC 16224 TaxID=1123024 RepID=A0A511D2R2_9PSEU|nr:hypothetical protein [Pseudonocardia asaccharolytica]GEL18813.1 hypothetical protein PA7_26500 [Pseudonocardia asaccharolytica DSM 44247 = NBRC 16224]